MFEGVQLRNQKLKYSISYSDREIDSSQKIRST